MLQLQASSTRSHRRNDAPPTLSGDVLGAMINLSGRRRFTSQRVVLYAVLASSGRAEMLPVAVEALTLFSQAHTALLQGKDNLPGVYCDALREAYFGVLQGDRHIREFIDLAEQALSAIRSGSKRASSLVDALVAGATPLLAVLNQLTQIYEEESRQHALRMKKKLQSVMTDIETIAKQARMVSFNAQIIAARAGNAGREFAVVASVLSNITAEIDELVHEALNGTV
jgi:hypothetical protein